MIWRRIPHQFVLAFAFGAIAIGVAAVILHGAATALSTADATIAYARTELQGIDDLAAANDALRRLAAYRTTLLGRTSAPSDAAARTAIRASISAIARAAAADRVIGDAAAAPLGALERRWALVSARANVSPADVSAVVAAVQPLLGAISGSSGLSNDPSIDGINFGDAIVRFPLSLADASAAASLAAVASASGDAALSRRFAAARLLAQAQTAVEVGMQDALDEMAVNPGAAKLLADAATANVRDFNALQASVTGTYVEARKPHGRRGIDRGLLGKLDSFCTSSFAVIDILRGGLDRVTRTRLEDTRQGRTALLWQTSGGLALDLSLMLTLAWISISSYRNGRRRLTAERAALESQRTALELALTHAEAQQALLRAKAQFRAVFDRAPTGMIIIDREYRISESNDAARAMLDESDQPISARAVVGDHAAVIEQIFSGDVHVHAGECRYNDGGQKPRWLHVSISSVRDEAGAAPFAILMLRDITDGKHLEAQLVFEAGHDALTGLPNRKLFLSILQQALDDREHTAASGTFCVVFIDFNDFKTINDSFGHQAGDKFLVDEAQRLRDSIRATDIVARVGGDEFALMLVGADRSDIEKNVARLQAVLSVPIDIEGQLVASSASFGIAAADSRYRYAAEIIRDADTAMYHAKSQGGRNYVAFDASMRDKVVRRMQLSIDIVHALEHNEMTLLYQPIVDLRTGKIRGCEALVRWRRRDGTVITPDEFIPLAEENGSIIEIGHWVTRTACEQMRQWNDLSRAGNLAGLHGDFVMHINLAVPEVHHVDLLPRLKSTLAETQIGREQIVLEITEGIVLKNTPRTRSTLTGLNAAGFQLCIDDFGTGYSSLRYLNELPLHGFKIDRSFVSDGGDELANASIVEMLMVLSRSLELDVIAEGIETPRQWEHLLELGCRNGQGYLFAPALHGAMFTTILETDLPLSTSPSAALGPPTP